MHLDYARIISYLYNVIIIFLKIQKNKKKIIYNIKTSVLRYLNGSKCKNYFTQRAIFFAIFFQAFGLCKNN